MAALPNITTPQAGVPGVATPGIATPAGAVAPAVAALPNITTPQAGVPGVATPGSIAPAGPVAPVLAALPNIATPLAGVPGVATPSSIAPAGMTAPVTIAFRLPGVMIDPVAIANLRVALGLTQGVRPGPSQPQNSAAFALLQIPQVTISSALALPLLGTPVVPVGSVSITTLAVPSPALRQSPALFNAFPIPTPVVATGFQSAQLAAPNATPLSIVAIQSTNAVTGLPTLAITQRR